MFTIIYGEANSFEFRLIINHFFQSDWRMSQDNQNFEGLFDHVAYMNKGFFGHKMFFQDFCRKKKWKKTRIEPVVTPYQTRINPIKKLENLVLDEKPSFS